MTQKIHEDMLDHLLNFYKDNPYVKMLGIDIDKVEYGSVSLSVTVQENLTNVYHIAHGGALMTLADTAMGATCISANKKVVTQSMNCYFIKAAPEGTKLFATGKIIHNGRQTMVCETEIIDEAGNIFCRATANFFVIGAFMDMRKK